MQGCKFKRLNRANLCNAIHSDWLTQVRWPNNDLVRMAEGCLYKNILKENKFLTFFLKNSTNLRVGLRKNWGWLLLTEGKMVWGQKSKCTGRAKKFELHDGGKFKGIHTWSIRIGEKKKKTWKIEIWDDAVQLLFRHPPLKVLHSEHLSEKIFFYTFKPCSFSNNCQSFEWNLTLLKFNFGSLQ